VAAADGVTVRNHYPSAADIDVDCSFPAAADDSVEQEQHTPRTAAAGESGAAAQSQQATPAQAQAEGCAPCSGTESLCAGAAQPVSTNSAATVSGLLRGGSVREASSPDECDPLLHACFNAQLLAYSTDPALLDRSTEILMIMLECVSFSLCLYPVCACCPQRILREPQAPQCLVVPSPACSMSFTICHVHDEMLSRRNNGLRDGWGVADAS
jgi:hypothetical protein